MPEEGDASLAKRRLADETIVPSSRVTTSNLPEVRFRPGELSKNNHALVLAV